MEQKTGTELRSKGIGRMVIFFLCGCIVGVLLMIFIPNPMQSQVGNTEQNLRRGAIGEGFGASRYLLFAQQAQSAQQPALASLFRAAAQGEQHRSQMMLMVGGMPDDLEENLRTAIHRETEDSQQLYPSFRDIAEQEGNPTAMQVFQMAAEGQAMTAELFSNALEALQSGQLTTSYHLCSHCGALYGDSAPDSCSVCGASSEDFSDFE